MALERVSFAKPIQHKPRLSAPYVPGVHSKRYWSDAEKKVVSDHYEEKGAQYCRGLLPGRSTGGVHQMALKLGLKVRGETQYRSPRASLQLDARIREEWLGMDAGKKGEVQRVADLLDVPRWWLSKRALALGLTVPRFVKEAAWSSAEIDLLKRTPLHHPDKAAMIFREHGFSRTASAIMVKSKRLNISRRYRSTLSATACAKILGVDAKNFTNWILKGLISATKREDSKRLPQQGGAPWSLERAYFRQWVIDNLERIDMRKVDKFAFVDLLTAEVPAK